MISRCQQTKWSKLATNLATTAMASSDRPKMDLTRSQQPEIEVIAADMLMQHLRNNLNDPTEPTKSSFIPDSNMLYYIVHATDNILGQNHHFGKSHYLCHPYVSRLYFGFLVSMRCMRTANDLTKQDQIFFAFLKNYPPESLCIPEPMMPPFIALSCSDTQYQILGMVYKTLPKPQNLHPRAKTTGVPYPKPSSWLLPNIPEIIGMINMITSDLSKTALESNRWPRPFNPNKRSEVSGATSQDEASINGCHGNLRQ